MSLRQSKREVLSENLKITHYDLNITPNFETFEFTCKETIVFYVAHNTHEIVLNAKDLLVTSAIIVYDGEVITPDNIEYQPETLTINLPYVLVPKIGVNGTLIVEVKGKINSELCGFYRTNYVARDGSRKVAGTTQFESHDARRAFLCADEPGKKSTYTITLNIPKDLIAVSNTPVKKEFGTSDKSLKTVQFEQTPVMSSYLVAWYIGELDYVETTCNLKATKVLIRTYTTPGNSSKAVFANEFAAKVIPYLSKYYDIDYPLSKLDQVAVPDFAAGAMENWGLVTFRENLIFANESTTEYQKMQIAAVIAHEIAHQWCGNLVTPEWWNDLWLKEGFATYLEWVIVDHFYPEWKCWEYFVGRSFQEALRLDELDSSHPINNDINLVAEIDEKFDTITYLKGCSMLRMLGEWLGEKDFQTGVRSYLKQFQYQNAVTDDLWEHLSEASGKNVKDMMDGWINQKGYPLVTVSKNRYNQYLFSQQAYGGNAMDRRMWKIPMHITMVENDPVMEDMVLDESWSCVSIEESQALVKVNTNRTGFYRVQYHPSMDSTLKCNIAEQTLGTLDRGEIFTGAFDLSKRGYESTIRSLQFIDSYINEPAYMVWSELISRLNLLKYMWQAHPSVKAAINSFYTKSLTPHLQHLGWEFSKNDTYQSLNMRQLVISTLASIGDPVVLDTCRRCFAEFIENPNANALNPNIRFSVLIAVIRFSDTGEELEQLKQIFQTVESTEVRLEIIKAIGSTPDGLRLKMSLDYVFKSGNVRTQDMDYVLESLDDTTYFVAWNYITENWDTILKTFGNGGMGLLNGLVCSVISGLIDESEMAEAKRFLNGHMSDVESIRNSINQCMEKVAKNLEWFKRDETAVAEWCIAFMNPSRKETVTVTGEKRTDKMKSCKAHDRDLKSVKNPITKLCTEDIIIMNSDGYVKR